MSFGYPYGGLRVAPVKPRLFVSYHHGGDQAWYEAFSQKFHDDYDVIYDNSLDRRIDSDNVEYVIQRIRDDYISGTSCTIVLVGAQTWGRKYVDWEIKATLDKEHGLLGVQLPTARIEQGKVIVPERLHDNIATGYAVWTSWQGLMARPTQFQEHVVEAKTKSSALIVNTRDRRLRNA